MIYAKWESLTEVKKRLYKVSLTENFDKGGVPIFKENKDIYISKESSNTLVIANSDAEKEKNFISPSIDLSIKAGESLVINDRKGVLYEEKKEILKENGYNVIKVDFGDPLNGNSWNPLSIIQKAYKEDNSLADELIENLGSYLFRERKSTDPFWSKSATDLFSGIAYYLFEKKEDVNFKDIINLLNEISNDEDKRTSLLSSIKDIANIYYKINSALNMPKETFQSILAVINISINPFIARESYYKMLSKSDFDITMIGKEKTAVFILNKNNSKMKFYTILINQIFDIMANSNTSKTINMIIDDADIIYPFDNINDIFYKASLNNIRISMIISSLQLLKNSYEGENIDAFESFFDIIIYLCTNDVFTLNKVSLLCGNKDKDTPLITPEELKVLSNNEAVILISRLHPFKIKLDY